jgi:hypothetical protein
MSAPRLNSRFGLRVQQSSRAQSPAVHIFLQGVVRHANGMLSVTPTCGSLAEMEAEIEQLKQELEEMLRQTRHAFRQSPEPAARA